MKQMANQFRDKTVLITGHTGFKGSWLVAWLNNLGAKVVGVALDPSTDPCHYTAAHLNEDIKDHRIDVRDAKKIAEVIVDAKPDFVFHLAAQALVRRSYDDPGETWETNVMGTLNVLEALRKLANECTAVMITSDKCYDNVEWVWGYRENDALGGPDPYSASKGAAELVIKSHVKSFFPKGKSKVRIASARAGNVIGGGDWSVDRIVPDCVKAWSEGKVVELRNPHATRPWQHVLEPLSGYLALATELSLNPDLHGEAFNFGPQAQQNKSVLELVKSMANTWDKVKWEDVSGTTKGPYESGLLKLNCDKALHLLNWHAVMDFEQTVKFTTEWYRNYYNDKASITDFTNSQINSYREVATNKGMPWVEKF
jgi:CDP-glucose 4,6-dehydratase